MSRHCMAEILPIRRKILSNQSINQSQRSWCCLHMGIPNNSLNRSDSRTLTLTNLLVGCTLLGTVITLSKISSIPEELWVLPQRAKGM